VPEPLPIESKHCYNFFPFDSFRLLFFHLGLIGYCPLSVPLRANMKLIAILALVSAVVAIPQGAPPAKGGIDGLLSALGTYLKSSPIGTFIDATDLTSTVSNDVVNGTSCKDINLIVARGSTEPGNMGKC
jgi:hypothetical protein